MSVEAHIRKKFEQAAETAKDQKISFSVFTYLMDDVLAVLAEQRRHLQDEKDKILSVMPKHDVCCVHCLDKGIIMGLDKALGVVEEATHPP